MAEINNVIAEASQDLQTIEDFVNLPADSEVYPRLLPSVNVGTLAGIRDAIFEKGGLPAKPFPTKAAMETEGASLPDGQLAQVYNETANNGLYEKKDGGWVKSNYDPLAQAKAYADAATYILKSLINSDNVVQGQGITATTGAVTTNAEYEATDFISIKEGDTFVYQGRVEGSTGIAAYDKNKVFVSSIYNFGSDGSLENDTRVFNITNANIAYIRACNKKTLGVEFKLLSKARVIDAVAEISNITPTLNYTVNLLDDVSLIQGFAIRSSDGGQFAISGYESTPLLAVDYLDSIEYTGALRGEVGIAAYNSSGAFYKTILNPAIAGITIIAGDYSFIIDDENIAYIRACNRLADGVTMNITSDKSFTGESIYKSLNATKSASPDIKINFISATEFHVLSLCPDGSYVSHIWVYAEREQFAEKGWYSTEIHHNGDYIVQGNYNTIHIMLDGGTVNDALFVGMGHGCETMLYCQFYLDGQEFDPSTATESISGKQFKVMSTSDNYKPDRELTIQTLGNTLSTMPAQPLEIRSRRVAQMTIAGNNRIEREQKLLVLKDNVKFNVLFGAMQRTIQPQINGVVQLNDKDGIRNYFPVSDTEPEPLPPSTVRLRAGIGFGDDNCFATRFTANGISKGYAYNVSTWQENADSSQRKKNHVQMALEQAGSIKVYFHPIYTTQLQAVKPKYIADVFNIGDVIEMVSTTEINVTKI